MAPEQILKPVLQPVEIGKEKRGKRMKAKTIKKVLSQVHKDWIGSINDNIVADFASGHTIVTGGSIASMLLGECVNDYDIYFRTKTAALEIARYYLKVYASTNPDGEEAVLTESKDGQISLGLRNSGFNGNVETEEDEPFGISVLVDEPIPEKNKYIPVFISPNAITLSNKIQLIFRFYGEPDEIHENYDFVHCTNYWTSWDNHLELRPRALEALLARELIYIGSKYPVCSIIRMRKFIKRGWSINAGQILKIIMQTNALDLTNYEVLRDQLVGVDTLFFVEVLEKLEHSNPDQVDTAYLFKILDKIF